MSKNWYTADLHLWHDNIIRYTKRPFKNVHEMHAAIIENFNSVVAPNDILYILGDISFYAGTKVANILAKINGQKVIIIGNHDAKNIGTLADDKRTKIIEVTRMKVFKDKGRTVTVCHHPSLTWDAQNRKGWMLHGHSHGVSPYITGIRRFDVGVDSFGMFPVTLDTLASIHNAFSSRYREKLFIRNGEVIETLPNNLKERTY